MTEPTRRNFPRHAHGLVHGCEARSLDASHLGSIAQFHAASLPGVAESQPLGFDVQITGKLTQIGHSEGSTTLAVQLNDDGDAFMFVISPTDPVAFLGEEAADDKAPVEITTAESVPARREPYRVT